MPWESMSMSGSFMVTTPTDTSLPAITRPLTSFETGSDQEAQRCFGRKGSCVGDVRFPFGEVYRQEQACIEAAKAIRRGVNVPGSQQGPDGLPPAGQPFALALSGGGLRAAAFQAGVIWRLAKENRLKDVEYLASVSGGGYVASAFASHCLQAEREFRAADRNSQLPAGHVDPRVDLHTWYLSVVAKMIVRMQNNAGNFVRDWVAHPCFLDEGAGCLPRICDGPLLWTMMGFTMAVNPIVFTIALWVPSVVTLQLFFGAGLRAAFCAPANNDFGTSILWHGSPLPTFVHTAVACTFVGSVAVCLKNLLPCLKIQHTRDGAKAPPGFLVAHAVSAFLKRFTITLYVLIFFIFLVLFLQEIAYTNYEVRQSMCQNFLNHTDAICSNTFRGQLWFEDPQFKNLTIPMDVPFDCANSSEYWGESFPRIMGLLFIGLLSIMACSCFTIGCCGTGILILIGKWIGPLMLLFATEAFVQYGIYAPITQNCSGFLSYDSASWHGFITVSLAAALVILPFYEELRAVFHTYYKRCLQKNFFAGGKDVFISSLKRSVYCPFFLITVTANDYQSPGDNHKISQLSLSPLHCGGEETKYVNVEEELSLAKCAALSGAGCLDAISLSMSDHMSLRFWLEVLNLSWGDFILFKGNTTPKMDQLIKCCCRGRHKKLGRRFFCRLQSALFWMVLLISMNIGWAIVRANYHGHCHVASWLFYWAMVMMLILILVSFFSFIPGLDLLGLSLLTRQLLQASRYYFVGERPPSMLYVTDGGIIDCTTIVMLMRRRCKRILLVLAGADANDDLLVLKQAMAVAVKEKVGSFFDPTDARRSVDDILVRFQTNPDTEYLHLGLCYNWDSQGRRCDDVIIGNLYIIKNRLPPHFEGRPVQPLLQEHDIINPNFEDIIGQEERGPGWQGLTSDQLGPFGCCDCCHAWCNCGPKFPHGTFTGYLYLTPQWCNSLIRLGFSLSTSALDAMAAGE